MSVRIWVPLVILVSFAGCGSRKDARPEPARWVRVALPEVKDQPESYALSGTVVPRGAAQSLSFQIAGRVVKVALREGEIVRRGEILAALDPTAYEAGLEAAAAQARSAQAAAARALDEFQRMKILHDRQSLAENDFLKFKLAEQASREQFLQAQANEKVARKALADTNLRALSGGVLTRRSVEPGVTVAAGQPAFEVAQVDPVEVQIGLPENLVGTVKAGQPSKVTVPALPGAAFEGTLCVINAAADPGSRTYMARIAVKNPKGTLKLGMVAEAWIQGDRRERMVLVPCEAIVKDPQGAPMVFEFRPQENKVVARRVVVGLLDGTRIQVRSGIDATTLVVVAGQNQLRDGSPAQVEAPQIPAGTGKD